MQERKPAISPSLLVLTVSLRSGGMSVNSLTNDLYRSLIRICEVYQYGKWLRELAPTKEIKSHI